MNDDKLQAVADQIVGKTLISRFTGICYALKIQRGFGFLITEDPDRKSVYFHIKNCVDGKFPRIGDTCSFEIATDEAGRFYALNIKTEVRADYTNRAAIIAQLESLAQSSVPKAEDA